MSDKKSFVLYNDYQKHVDRLSDDDAGRLFKALFRYSISGEEPELSASADIAFSFISAQIDRDSKKWENTRQKRSDAAKKRWADDSKCIPGNANDAVNVNGTVNVNVNDTVNVSGNVINKGQQAAAPTTTASIYGVFKNVTLSDQDMRALMDRFGADNVQTYIDRISRYQQEKGKTYSNHYAKLIEWMQKDGVTKPDHSYDLEEYKRLANKI